MTQYPASTCRNATTAAPVPSRFDGNDADDSVAGLSQQDRYATKAERIRELEDALARHGR
jgi:hypothetical protein